MPRLPELTNRNSIPEDARAAFDYLVQTRGASRLPFSVVLNAPEICQRVAHVGTYCRFESSLPPAVTELATLTAAREFDAAFEWAAHVPLARQRGVSDEAVDVIGRKRPVDALKDDEALPIRCAREILHDHRLQDATFEAARKAYGEQGVIEIVALAGYYGMLACLINALEILPPPDAPALP
jgi:4-carboxymuconolactone decarboxylase